MMVITLTIHYQSLSHILGVIGHYSAWMVNNMINNMTKIWLTNNMINNMVNDMIKNNGYHIDHCQCLSHILGIIEHYSAWMDSDAYSDFDSSEALTHSSFYTRTHLHTKKAFTHRRVDTQTLLHAAAFAHRSFYTQRLLHTDDYTQTLLHTEPFAHRSLYTPKLLHTEAFTHRRFYTQALLHIGAFTHRSFYT